MVKNDRWIIEMAQKGMLEPFCDRQVKQDVISYGVSSYGYDIRVANEFKIFSGNSGTIIDPKNINKDNFLDYKGDVCIIKPNSFILARSFEYLRIPRDVLVICFGKSTYSRCGVLVNITPLEPEWEGYITMAISNLTSYPVKIYGNEGIAQLVFIQSSELCEISYKDKSGKYQSQKDITISKV